MARAISDWLSGDARQLLLCASRKLVVRDPTNVILDPNVWLFDPCADVLMRHLSSDVMCSLPLGHTVAHRGLDVDANIEMFWDQGVYWPPSSR